MHDERREAFIDRVILTERLSPSVAIMSSAAHPVPVTDMQDLVPVARELVERELALRLAHEPTTLRFHREWSGGWRVRVEIGKPARGRLDFVLFETPSKALLALAHPMPDAWRDPAGVEASDGSRWCWSAEGLVVPAA